MINLDGRVALVTGASRGIGQGIAAELAAAGATVVGTATSDPGAEAITRDLSGSGGRGVKLDVTSEQSIQEALAAISDLDAPSILVNNAGLTQDMLLLRMKESDWDTVMDTNLKSIYRMSKALLRGMMKGRYGRIINITSVVGMTGNAGQANYAAAKAGMIGFTKSLAQEVASRGVTANCIAPGFIDTDMTAALTDAQREPLLKQIPMSRLGDASDIAAAVVFLASDRAGYITGDTLHVNGGMYMP